MASPAVLSTVKLPLTQKPTMSSEGDWRRTYEDIFALQNTIRILLTLFPEDAPNNAEPYVRENNTWILLSDAIVINWGDITGTLADQTDLATVLAGKIDEAPMDGKLYGRKNGTWVEIVLP